MKSYHDDLILQFDDAVTGNAASGALVTVFNAGLATKPAIFDVFGSPISNPLTTDIKGNFSFQVADGEYDIVGRAGTPDETRRDQVQIIEQSGVDAPFSSVASMVAFAAHTAGDFVSTEGYTIAGDNGHGLYLIETVAAFVGTPDEILDFTITGGLLIARLMPQDRIRSEQAGVDLTGVTGTAVKINAALVLTKKRKTNFHFSGGIYKVDASYQLPTTTGFIISGDGYNTFFDATAGATLYDVFKAPASVCENMVIKDLRIKGNPTTGSYAIDFSFCRNDSYMKGIFIDTGANGIKQNTSWYNGSSNIFIRDCAGIGLHLQALTTTDTVNGIEFNKIFCNGNGTNYKLESTGGSSSTAIVFTGCTNENSTTTSMEIDGFSGVVLVGMYFENNFKTGSIAGDIVDVKCDNGSVSIIGGTMQTSSTGMNSGAFLFGGDGLVEISGIPFIRKAGLNTAYDPSTRILVGRVRASDFTDTEALRTAALRNDDFEIYGKLTAGAAYLNTHTQPVAFPLETVPAGGTFFLARIDLTTAQANEVFAFDVYATDMIPLDAVPRFGEIKHRVVVFKKGASYFISDFEVYDILGLSSTHGSLSVAMVGAVATVSYTAFATTDSQVYITIGPVRCGNVARVVSIK